MSATTPPARCLLAFAVWLPSSVSVLCDVHRRAAGEKEGGGGVCAFAPAHGPRYFATGAGHFAEWDCVAPRGRPLEATLFFFM